MKYLFLIITGLLVIASVITVKSMPDATSDKPIIYWVTDANPARGEQVKLFGQWLKSNGYPDIELRLDMANGDRTKRIIQSVSGIAGDLMDTRDGEMEFFHAMGVLVDVTEQAKALNFTPAKTYPALKFDLGIKNPKGEFRQYRFPCNAFSPAMFVNLDTFRQHGVAPPPDRWTIDEFRTLGREFVEKANTGRARRTVFFADTLARSVFARSLGIDGFNETLTDPLLDDPRSIATWKLIYDMTYSDRLIPTAADRASFAGQSGYGGIGARMFLSDDPQQGQIPLLWTGRHLLIEFRKTNPIREQQGKDLIGLKVVEHPHGGIPNTDILTRAAVIYAGSDHVDLAAYFLSFLASAEYNMQIVKDGDSLPPNPQFTQIEEYSRPPDFPNEWQVHDPFAKAALELAIGKSSSPFILASQVTRIELNAFESYMNNRDTAEEAAAKAVQEIRAEIALTLRENPKLKTKFDMLVARQSQIDQKRKLLEELEAKGIAPDDGQKIPEDWIENVYYQTIYQRKGWLISSDASASIQSGPQTWPEIGGGK